MYSSIVVFVIFLFYSCVADAKIAHNHRLNDLITKPIRDDPSGFYALPVTYYTKEQQEAQTGATKYFVIRQCGDSTGNLPYVQLSIIAPGNPTFNTSGDKSYIVLELSNTKDEWTNKTIFRVNYIYDIKTPIIFSTIGWEYSSQPQDIYGRYRAYGSSVMITLLISYSATPNPNVGIYKYGYIPGTISTGIIYPELDQYIKASQIYEVKNNEHVVFNFSVCTRESIDPDEWKTYTLSINVISDLAAPLSAFDLVACSVSEYPDPTDCTFNNIDAVKNQKAIPLVDLQITNDEYLDLSRGTYLTVYGEGGNANGNNLFLIEVQVTKIKS